MGKLSEQDKQEIKKQARELLVEFNKKLSDIKGELQEEFESKEARKEGDGWNSDANFKEAILQNAPFVKDDFIVGEKGGWR